MTVPEPGALAGAADWVDGLLTGNLTLGLATLGVIGLGLAMLSGRLDIRRGIGVLFGCFLVLGAPAVARGIMGVRNPQITTLPTPSLTLPPSPAPEARKVQTVDDPYAGASLIRN